MGATKHLPKTHEYWVIVAYAGEHSPTSAAAPMSRVSQMVSSIVPAGQEPRPPKRKPRSGERRGFRSGRSTGLGGCVTVRSMEQPDIIAGSGFLIAEAGRRSDAYSDR